MTALAEELASRNQEAGSMDAADFQPATPLKLNLGSGDSQMEGYVNLDRKLGTEVCPLPQYADNSVDEVRASHVLEHFSHRDEVGDVLREWHRVLKPGGILKVAVPDFEWIVQQYLAGKPINTTGYVMGGHVDADDRHGAIFDREELSRALRTIGFYDVRPWKSEINDCAALPVSLNLQGKKKGPLPKLRIAGAMSVPRLGFQDNFFCWAQALLPLGIAPAKYDGAFWGQCLERVMTGQLDGADYILTVDYDSIFTREHVEHLIRLAAEYPDADAIAPVQLMRSGETLLTTIVGDDNKPTGRICFDELHEKEMIRAYSAHFGLTLIKTAALQRMQHPWFLGVPNDKGEWKENRTDDDTYFWRKWKQVGNSLYLASHVVLGHGQFMVSWPGRNMEPIYQNPKDFWDDGIPAGAWQ